MSELPTLLSATQVTALVVAYFPQVQHGNGLVTIERVDHAGTVVRMAHDDGAIRPGGTISGPAMFKLADVGVYAAILGVLGEKGLQAVTTNMTINFLSRPGPVDLIAHVRILKRGRRLAVAEALIYADGLDDPVAHATATYSIPPPKLKLVL